jgi:hypothetical protein
MSGHQFDQIAQEILKQKQRMNKLQAENADLRQQIADLRSGRGIFVDICGSRFALRDDTSHVQAKPASAVQSTGSPLTATVATSTPLEAQPLQQQIVDAPTAEIAGITPQALEQSAKEQESQAKNEAGKKSTEAESTFLEEILLDEFNNALTSPNSVWQDPAEKKQSQPQKKSQEAINEEQKAALRRELMGSFLLE